MIKRTHYCSQLREGDIGKEAALVGWVHSLRDHGDLTFVDLRDAGGVSQLVFDPSKNKDLHARARKLRSEYVIGVRGKVAERPEGTKNPKIATGSVELDVAELEVLNKSQTAPFEILDNIVLTDELRLKYRYLDLRRPCMQKNLRIRHRVCKIMRDYLDARGFTEVETPVLTKSTPEGARDYLVPSRVNPGKFYALPQSPQLFKQLLMVAGLDKYFQIAKCFRDEDLRKDRQPEFTQLDIEMSFIEEEDIYRLSEGLLKELYEDILGVKLEIPFPRLAHAEAMSRFGTDKPDMRFGMEIKDLTARLKDTRFEIFKKTLAAGGKIVAINLKAASDLSRTRIDSLTDFVKEYGARGLAYFRFEKDKVVSPIEKFFSPEEIEIIKEAMGAKADGDIVFIVADRERVAQEALGSLRLKLGEERGLIDKKTFRLSWVTDFPLLKYNDEEKRWESEHHPFTSCKEEDEALLDDEKGYPRVRARSYDLVINGVEIGSGSIRIHREDLQEKIFKIIGISRGEAESRFGFLLEALKYGAPPHGGFAFGLDRLITLFTGDESIREVIAFPKTQKAYCPLTDAPSEVDDRQLRELHIKKIK